MIKRLKKILVKIAYGFTLLVLFAASFRIKMMNTMGLSSAAGFALQSSAKETLITMDEVEREFISVPFINKDGKVVERSIKFYRPKNAEGAIPLIYVPHYAIDEGSLDWQTYLLNGWAVASPDEFDTIYNEVLVSDNHAALYTLRNKEDIDKERIAVVGGSASGYTTLMLNGLQLGTVAAITNAPVTNVYFNFKQHFLAANEVNKNWKLLELPITYVAMSVPRFTKNNTYIESLNDPNKWEELSPIGLAKMFSSPIVINHNTSDMLVPVDSTSKAYTYEGHDGSLPADLSTRLPQDNPGNLSKSLEELLPAGTVSTEKIVYADLPLDYEMSYREDVQISINILDDGKVNAINSHNQTNVTEIKTMHFADYLKDMFAKGLGQTEVLSDEKSIAPIGTISG